MYNHSALCLIVRELIITRDKRHFLRYSMGYNRQIIRVVMLGNKLQMPLIFLSHYP